MRECSFCGKQNPSHLYACSNCGCILVAGSTPDAVAPSMYHTPTSDRGYSPLASGEMPYSFGVARSARTFYGQSGSGIRGTQSYNYEIPPSGQSQSSSYGQSSGTYVGAPPTMAPPPGRPGSPQLSNRMVALLIAFALLVMLSGIGLIVYAGVIHPAQLHADATATVQSIQTANGHITATAQVLATVQAHATSTAQRQATAQAQATTTALQNLYTQSTAGTPVMNETLAAQTGSNWDVYDAVGGGGCAFTGGALHASVMQSHFYVPCFAHATNFSNFAFELQINILKGDEGGLIFRANDANSTFYVFRIGRDGNYSLYVSKDAKTSVPIADDTSSAIKTAAGQPNTLTVVAQNNTIYMYINKQFAGSINDSMYKTGEIGVFAGDNTNATEVAFSNIRIWKL